MSRENMELVRRMFDQIGTHSENAEALYELLDRDVVWDTSALELPGMGVHRGHAGVREFWRRWLGTWEQWEFWPEKFIDAGDHVVVVVRQRGRGKASGVQVEQRHAQVWTLRDGRIIRHTLYRDVDVALRALGRSE
jgi:ketosteroid isomerase-like protein